MKQNITHCGKDVKTILPPCGKMSKGKPDRYLSMTEASIPGLAAHVNVIHILPRSGKIMGQSQPGG
jgi:hypothetical protein